MNETEREAERWRGQVDARLVNIETNADRRERKQDEFAVQMLEMHKRIEQKVDSLGGAIRFGRGAAWVIIPLLVFLGGLLINHITHHDIAVVPETKASPK